MCFIKYTVYRIGDDIFVSNKDGGFLKNVFVGYLKKVVQELFVEMRGFIYFY